MVARIRDAWVSRIQAGHFPSSPCVFSAVTLEKSETCATATNGKPKTCRNTPMMNSVSIHAKSPAQTKAEKINKVSNIATYLCPFLARIQPVRANQSMRLEPIGLVMKMRHQMPEMLQIAKPMASTTRSATRQLSQRTNRKPEITSMPQRQYMMLFSSSPYPKNFWVSGVTIVWRGDNSTEPLTDGVHDIRRDSYISAS